MGALLTGFATTIAKDLAVETGKSIIADRKAKGSWESVFINTGAFFREFENGPDSYSEEIKWVLSEENMSAMADALKGDNGYHLFDKMVDFLRRLMEGSNVPHNDALVLANRIANAIIEQLPEIAPDKYDRHIIQRWHEENSEKLQEIARDIQQLKDSYLKYNKNISVFSAEDINNDLRRDTNDPSIGIDFFSVDDTEFQQQFAEKLFEEKIYVKCRCREEGIYSIVNELWRVNDTRPLFIVDVQEDWEYLIENACSGNIFIPRFYAEEIPAIPDNTNIFLLSDDMPDYKKEAIQLRPRRRSTIVNSLQTAGMDYESAYHLVEKTNGLYMPMKKIIYNGVINNNLDWIERLKSRVKKTCLLVGKWTDCDGDRLIIEKMSGMKYAEFMDAVDPYMKGEDPLIYKMNTHPYTSYCLASAENTWVNMTIGTEDPMWGLYVECLKEALYEAEPLFTYSTKEKLAAQLNGEKLFWSEEIRRGLLRTLILMKCFNNDDSYQYAIDNIVMEVLARIKTPEQWNYISRFIEDLCEASPRAVIERLKKELETPSGLMVLFDKQDNDFIFGNNNYIHILFAIEELLTIKEYAWDGWNTILKLDDCSFEYVYSNSPESIIKMVLCPWYNFSAINNISSKVKATKNVLENDRNGWDRIFEALPANQDSVFGSLRTPRYRDHEEMSEATTESMGKVTAEYLDLLLSNIEFKTERLIKLIKISDKLEGDDRRRVFGEVLEGVSHLTDIEIADIKDTIREIIYHHRYFASSAWAMGKDALEEYESLLCEIEVTTEELEYRYLFKSRWNVPVPNPIPYDEGGFEENEEKTRAFITDKLKEFREKGLDLRKLAESCRSFEQSTLGVYLAKAASDIFDIELFSMLLEVQPEGLMATDYYSNIAGNNDALFETIIEQAQNKGCSFEVLASLYKVELMSSGTRKAVSQADDEVKSLLWSNYHYGMVRKDWEWSLSECKKHGTIDSYINMLYDYSRSNHDRDNLYELLLGVTDVRRDVPVQSCMTEYYLQELLKPLQSAYCMDEEKSKGIAMIEMLFSSCLDWSDCKCLKMVMQKSPELLAELISIKYKKDDKTDEQVPVSEKEEQRISNAYRLYEMAKFCPAEIDGAVEEERLREWLQKLRSLLAENNQESLFSSVIGRLLSFSPLGNDNYEPCEAVRNIIEEYADERFENAYIIAVRNRRGVFTPSAGDQERTIARRFRENAEQLRSEYPKTASMYYQLCRLYEAEAIEERERAERGVY